MDSKIYKFTKKGTLYPSMSTYDIYTKVPLVHIPPDWETVKAYRMDLQQSGEGKRHVFTQAVQEFVREHNAMMELYRSKQGEWEGVQWTVQRG